MDQHQLQHSGLMSPPSPKRAKVNESPLSAVIQHSYGAQQTSTFSSQHLNNSGAHNAQFAAPAPLGHTVVDKVHPTSPNDANIPSPVTSADNGTANQAAVAPDSANLELSSVLIPLFHKSEDFRLRREQYISDWFFKLNELMTYFYSVFAHASQARQAHITELLERIHAQHRENETLEGKLNRLRQSTASFYATLNIGPMK